MTVCIGVYCVESVATVYLNLHRFRTPNNRQICTYDGYCMVDVKQLDYCDIVCGNWVSHVLYCSLYCVS